MLDEWSWVKCSTNMRRDPHKEPLFPLSPPPLDNHTHACKHTVKIKSTASGQTYALIWISVTSKALHAKHGIMYEAVIEGVFDLKVCPYDTFVCFCMKLCIPTLCHPDYIVWQMETPKQMWKNFFNSPCKHWGNNTS